VSALGTQPSPVRVKRVGLVTSCHPFSPLYEGSHVLVYVPYQTVDYVALCSPPTYYGLASNSFSIKCANNVALGTQ